MIVSGTFTNQKNNKVYSVKPSEQELKSVDSFYKNQLLIARLLIAVPFMMILIGLIGLIRENIYSD
ncbi:MAG: hypothetical protein KGV51_07025 [Moraxellaceae bacterium]|nr:hypothetical protein [Moraxellaceae bacterium]